MSKVSYIPSRDGLVLAFGPLKRRPTRALGQFKLWWDEEGCIDGIDITPFMEVLEEFVKNLNTLRLDGIWEGVEITEEDIKETREELLDKLGEKW